MLQWQNIAHLLKKSNIRMVSYFNVTIDGGPEYLISVGDTGQVEVL